MPVFRDWESANILCKMLDQVLEASGRVDARILLVEDGSPEPIQPWESFSPRLVTSIEVLELRRNLGHQRAIAVGLCHVHDHIPCDGVVVMDSDGEDKPEDVVVLIERLIARPSCIVFAERRLRFGTVAFRVGYFLFRMLHRLLTGVPVRVGNFSAVPARSLHRLVWMSELWNHYAGAIFRSRLPYTAIPLNRGRRYHGRPQMDLVSLVAHGMSGIATFHDAAATRILIAIVAGNSIIVTAMLLVALVRLATDRAIPGWATFTGGLLLVLLVQLVAIAFSLLFSLVTTRTHTSVLPARDYALFVEKVTILWQTPRA